MEGRCETCKYWCVISAEQEGEVWGDCLAVEDDKKGRAAYIKAVDVAFLMTRGDFGCVLWEPKR